MADKIHVLMVDDEERFRLTMSKQLGKKGYQITMAASGEEAVGILKDISPDVVILDLKMRRMDGIETLSRIKKIRPDTQVIMLTGQGARDSAEKAVELGAFDYISKPCDIDLLLARIQDAYAHKTAKGKKTAEKKAGDIMIHIDDYTVVFEDQTVQEAIAGLLSSFQGLIASNSVMETGHRSVVVFSRDKKLRGILSIKDLIRKCRPAYLSAPKPSTADSIQFSPLFWSGLFKSQVRDLGGKKVCEVMSESPLSVDEDANLMEIADLMITQNKRRVLVTRGDDVVGVVREQELFFEMANILLKESKTDRFKEA